MADEADIANEQAARWLNQSINNLSANTKKLAPKGFCHYCEHEFDPSDESTKARLFCDLDCSKDYETEQRLRSRK